jgi:hypothetical protein
MGILAADMFGNGDACDGAGAFLDDPGIPFMKLAIAAVFCTDNHREGDAPECLANSEVTV